jgi:hypothetical protein
MPTYNVAFSVYLSEVENAQAGGVQMPVTIQVKAKDPEDAGKKLKKGLERMINPGRDDGYPFK